MIRVDTNYVIRYLMNDNEEMAEKAEKILENEKVFLANEIIAEVVYVLEGVYQIQKDDIRNSLQELVSFKNILVDNKQVMMNALTLYEEKNLDFVDCLLCAYSPNEKVLTFDKKLNKCIDNKK